MTVRVGPGPARRLPRTDSLTPLRAGVFIRQGAWIVVVQRLEFDRGLQLRGVLAIARHAELSITRCVALYSSGAWRAGFACLYVASVCSSCSTRARFCGTTHNEHVYLERQRPPDRVSRWYSPSRLARVFLRHHKRREASLSHRLVRVV